MALSINTNLASMNAQGNVNKTQSRLEKSLERLSSGLRINSAKDDAAGLAISNRMTAQVRGLNQAVRNANDGISLAQTAEGALGEVNTNLQRLRELAVQAANATNSDDDRAALQEEASLLLEEIDRIAGETSFNGITLLDGSFTKQTFQVGANAGQTLNISMGSAKTSKLGTDSTAALTAQGSQAAISEGDLIINGVTIRSTSASDDAASYPGSSKAASAIAKAAAINASSAETGVTATADENVLEGAYMSGAAGSGTLTLNGVNIAITTTDDASASRTSVVEAINAVSGQTGVVATNTGKDATGVTLTAADGRNITVKFGAPTTGTFDASSTGITGLSSNELVGTSMTGAAGTGYIRINGVDTGLIETTTDTATSRANTVAAINAISDKTGVVAVDTGDDSTGITLTASDGRHIGTELLAVSGTFTEASTGVNAVQATSGAVTLTDSAAHDFQINGVTVSFTSGASAGASATAIVDAINDNADLQAMGITAKTDTVGTALIVTSTNGTALDFTAGASTTLAQLGGIADTNATVGGTVTATTNSTTYDFELNGETLSFTTDASATAAESAALIRDAINNNSNLQESGITAELNAAGDGFIVHSTKGAAITFTDGTANRAALGGIADKTASQVASGEASTVEATDYSSYTLTSNKEIVISSGSGSSSDLAEIGLVSGTYDSQTAYASTTTNNGRAMGEGDVKINGVLIGASSAASDTYSRYSDSVSATEAEQLTSASAIAKAAAINAMSDQTKVTATVNENVSDGANMTSGSAGTGKIVVNGVETAAIGVAAVGGDATTAGENRAAVIDAINAISTQTGVVAEDTNDIEGGIRLVAADGRNINVEFEGGLNSANTGVSGSDVTQTLGFSGTMVSGANAGTITINGYELSVTTAGTTEDGDRDIIAAAINSISDKTGVTAENTGSDSTGITLSSINGVGFTVSLGGALTDANTGIGVDATTKSATVDGRSDTTYGTYTLTSTSSFKVEKGTTASLENSGLAVGTYGSGKSGMALSDIDLSTAEGASKAIEAIDNAMKQIDTSRSSLGAVQNRFTATISNLTNTSENLESASSRITDADFAAETANMSKEQVLQQAGVSVLAQANKLPQQLLSLLQ